MTSDAPQIPLPEAPSLQQPFPGAMSATSPVSQPRRTVMEIPSPLPRPSFIFRTDGSYSNDANWVFSDWDARISQSINASLTDPGASEIQQPRRFLLSSACKRHDIVYIVMHHRYCTWSRNRQAAYHLMQPFTPDAIDSGFAGLSTLLKSNDTLTAAQLEWFSNFPASTFDSFVPSPFLASITDQIFKFLSNFAAQWQGFQSHIISRGFPVLVCEMESTLRCSSCIAQDLIFTLSRRILGYPDGPFSDAFSDIFSRDRNFESTLALKDVSNDMIRLAREASVRNYLGLITHIRSQTQNMSPKPHTSPSQEVPTTEPTAEQETNRIQANQIPSNTVASRVSGLEQGPFQCFSQNQHSQTSRVFKVLPSTNQSTRQPGPSMSSSTNNSPTAFRYPGLPTVQSALSTPPQVQPRGVPTFVAQHGQLAAPQPKAPTPNPAALLDPQPGKVLRLIPESQYPPSAYGLSSLKVGLHLARQRSPRRVPVNIEPTRYFQYVDNLVVQPTKLEASIQLTHIKFSLSEDQLQKLPTRQAEFDLCSLPVVRFENNSLRFRVRVCRFSSGDSEISEARWAESSTFWPEQMHITINAMPCLLSRKQHFHADLPAEVTTDVKSGYNELHVSLPSLSGNESGYDYFIAVEQITVQAFASVWRKVNGSPHASEDATRDTIKDCYGVRGSNEIALLGSTLNVSICDPMSSQMCGIPARGVNCKHLECFDLENWLQSRPNKPRSGQTEPCLVDCWACPICGGDARPNQLRICDYFSNVVKRLRESGHSEMRTIAVSENGEWHPLDETSHQKRESPSQPGGSLHLQRSMPKAIEVIEILDD